MTATQAIAVGAREYPARLAAALASPPTLYVRGDASVLARPCVAVVGTREPSHAGAVIAYRVATAIARVYPRGHEAWAADIVARGGALVSEHPDGVPPSPQRFVARNRIASGLSVATVVVECGERSGTMHTARFAHKQGRAVIVVRSTAEGFDASGGDALIRTIGATPAHSVAEVMAAVRRAMGARKE